MLSSYVVLSRASLPSPTLASFYTPHEPFHVEWQSKQRTYAPPSYGHETTPPLCLAQPYYGGNVSPLHLSLIHTLESHNGGTDCKTINDKFNIFENSLST
jgi:hypothetical protein